jgi:hypothetical protein
MKTPLHAHHLSIDIADTANTWMAMMVCPIGSL